MSTTTQRSAGRATTADVTFAYEVTTTEGVHGLTVETNDVVWL